MLNKLTILLLITLLCSCEKDNLSELQDIIYVRRNGADMPAYIYGNASEKTFLIFLHGGPGGSGLQLRSLSACQNLEESCAMVYWDQRGQGMSQGHYHSSDNSLDEMAKDVKALALVLKNKYGQDIRLFLMGVSWGGTLGTKTMVTEDFQHLFEGWIELEGGHDYQAMFSEGIKQLINIGNEQISQGNSPDYWQGVLTEIEETDTSIYNGENYSVNSKAFEAESVLTNDGVIYAGNESINRARMHVYLYENWITVNTTAIFTSRDINQNENLFYNYSLTDELYKIEIPTLFIYGKYDIVTPPALGYSAYERVNSADKKIVILEQSGHQSITSEPEIIVREITDFINK
jgi:pimeloyl-ACP methyl ester carboxylesterase